MRMNLVQGEINAYVFSGTVEQPVYLCIAVFNIYSGRLEFNAECIRVLRLQGIELDVLVREELMVVDQHKQIGWKLTFYKDIFEGTTVRIFTPNCKVTTRSLPVLPKVKFATLPPIPEL